MRSEFWRDRKVFITGCTGILGSWLTRTLVDQGAEVVGLIRDRVPNCELIRSGTHKRIVQIDGDVTDLALMERVLNEYEIDSVFHLAAQSLVRIGNRVPISTFESNIRGTWLVLDACRQSKTVERIVVASSDKAYGDHEQLPYTEEAPLQGLQPYAVSKSCADMIARTYAGTYDMPIGVTRCGNIYGGGDLNWDRIVPGTMRSVLRGERPEIRSDGTFQRDFLYVDDIVDAYLRLAEHLDDPAFHGQAFNFGMDNPRTARELVDAIIAISDYPEFEPIILNQANHEIKNQYLSSDKAHRLLGWKPRYSLKQGLQLTMDWYEQYMIEVEGLAVRA